MTYYQKTRKWALRFLKFNLVGLAVWIINTVFFFVFSGMFGWITWFIVGADSAVLQFAIINLLNKTRKGQMFDSCPSSVVEIGD